MSSYKVRQERKALLRRLHLSNAVKRRDRKNYEYNLADLRQENDAIRRESAARVYDARISGPIRFDRPVDLCEHNTPRTNVHDCRLRMVCNTLRIDPMILIHEKGEEWLRHMRHRVVDDLARTLVKDGMLDIEMPGADEMRRAEWSNSRFTKTENLSVRWAFLIAPVPIRQPQHEQAIP